MAITPGNTSDYKAALQCLAAMPPSKHLIADKGYDSDWLRGWLEMRGTEAVIPPRANRNFQYPYDKALYRERNLIERMFCRLKDFRRIATRFDRNLKSYLAALSIVAALVWWL
jgi:transposase